MIFFQQPSLAKKVKVYTPQDQYLYEQKSLREQEVEKYERSLLPESGYMTRDEYEEASKDISNEDIKVPAYEPPRDIKMKYTPQPIYELARYNEPPGSPDIHLDRHFKFDRQENAGAVTSPNKDIMAYPTVYYYASNNCISGDIFVIPLDKSLPVVERIQRANVVKRLANPILSTDKDITVKNTFRTMTPIDFSPDGTKLVAKEKIGNSYDGIWKTNLWVYDFTTQTATTFPEIRQAIVFYWKNQDDIVLDEKRWDIYPLGFDADNPNRVIVSAYGYTGRIPKFLGNWSIDCEGKTTELVSLLKPEANVSISGWKIVQTGVVNPQKVMADEKKKDKEIKKKRKAEKKALKKAKKSKKKALKKKLKEMKKETKKEIHQYNKQMNKSGLTGAN